MFGMRKRNKGSSAAVRMTQFLDHDSSETITIGPPGASGASQQPLMLKSVMQDCRPPSCYTIVLLVVL